MVKRMKFRGRKSGNSAAVALLLTLSLCTLGQEPPAQSAQSPQPAQPPEKESRITPEQTKQLFNSVNQILSFASDDTQLKIHHEVKRRLISREQVEKYILDKFHEDKDTKRMQREEIVLKKFGLLDRDFQLQPFLVSLLKEQIAGYYDNKTKPVNLLDWVKPDEQKPVLAHELTHALQDQKVGLEKRGSNGFKGVSKTASEDAQRVPVDELETARQAVTEGQAMV